MVLEVNSVIVGLKKNGYTFRGGNFQIIFIPPEKGSTKKRKEFAPFRKSTKKGKSLLPLGST